VPNSEGLGLSNGSRLLFLLWILWKIMPDGGQNPKKKEELDPLSEWVKNIKSLLV
jgi:hypothetical protein